MGETATAPTERSEEAPAPPPALEVDQDDVRAAIVMGVLFVGSILVSMLLAQTFIAEEVPPVFEDPQSATNPLLYLGIVVIFTLFILLIARLGLQAVIQWIILGAVFFTMGYVFQPLLSHYVSPTSAAGPLGFSWAAWISGLTAAGLTALLYYYPEWYVVDASGVAVAAGATGIFGYSFGLFPALVLLVGFAIYDAIAVYRTQHMLSLADSVMQLRLPIMLVVPKTADYSFLEGERMEEAVGPRSLTHDRPPWEVTRHIQEGTLEGDGGRDALFMGLGDIVIPGVLVVSALIFLSERTASMTSVLGLAPHLFVSLATLVGATAGFAVLMRSVLKGTPHAGLPALNGGALLGFLSTTLWLYGTAPLIPQF